VSVLSGPMRPAQEANALQAPSQAIGTFALDASLDCHGWSIVGLRYKGVCTGARHGSWFAASPPRGAAAAGGFAPIWGTVVPAVLLESCRPDGYCP